MKGTTLHWTAYVISLLAMGVLQLSEGNSFVLPLLMVAFAASAFVPYRFGDSRAPVWMLRLALWGVIIGLDLNRPDTPANAFFTSHAQLNWTGELFAAELMIQAWKRRPEGGGRGIATLLLSGLVFLIASNVQDNAFFFGRASFPYILYAAPIYMFFALLAMRYFREPRPGSIALSSVASGSITQTDSEDTARDTEQIGRAAHTLRVSYALTVVLAIGLGLGIHVGFRRFRSELTTLGMKMLNERQYRMNGISTSPYLRATDRLKGSAERVLVIQGKNDNPHWRVMAFHLYQRGGWGPASEARRSTKVTILKNEIGSGRRMPRSGSTETLTVTRVSTNGGLLCAPLNTTSLDPLENEEMRWAKEFGPVSVKRGTLNDYSVDVSRDETFQGPFCTPPIPKERKLLEAVPDEIEPEVHALARTIVLGIPAQDRRAQARAIEQYLLANHKYALSYTPGPGDQVSNFLLKKGAAHCEFFASSAVILARCVGIPSRYVIGFYAHESDGPTKTIVRYQDAHAWAECWIEGTGWITIDGTPASGRPDVLSQSVPSWQRFTERLQDITQRIQEWLGGANSWKAGFAIGIVVFCVLGWQWWQQHRRTVPGSEGIITYAAPDVSLAELSLRFNKLCTARGLTCPPQKTWQEHLQSLTNAPIPVPSPQPGKESDVAPSLNIDLALRFQRAYNAARFGPPPTPAQIDTLKEMLTELEGKPMV